MKKLLFPALLLLVALLTLVSCDRDDRTTTSPPTVTEHVHVYDRQAFWDRYLASAATCTEAAKYYYSCTCGASSTDTFEHGSISEHSYIDGICTLCGANAAVYSDGLEYASDGTCYILSGIGICTDTDIVIPPTYLGQAVVSINSYAFENCKELTSVTIPNSVTSIGYSAFAFCTGLTSITIPDSVTTIGSYAFYGCTGLTSITIPDSVTTIGSYAFDRCYKLIEVYNRSGLTITAGSSSNGGVGYYARNVYTTEGGSKLHNVDDFIFYVDVATVYLMAYTGTDTDITLPDYGGKNYGIYQYAFYNCSNLTNVVIPDSVTSIGNYALYGCTGLTSITFADTSTWYRTTDSTNWSNHTGGTQTDLTSPSSNAAYFTSTYVDYYWYKN